jgi:stringent starvation protein B
MHMDNEWVTFSARFGGMSHSIEVPVGNVVAIYARETGEGMAFENLPQPAGAEVDGSDDFQDSGQQNEQSDAPQPPRGRPQLKVVK